MTVLLGTEKAFGYAEVEQTVKLSVQPAVSIEKKVSVESGTINARTGAHSGLNASFLLQTNGSDEEYDFIVGSKIMVSDGAEVSAYTDNGALIFGNVTVLPTLSAVNDIKQAGKNNKNVIAYPIDMTITNSMEVDYQANKVTEEGLGCYTVLVKDSAEGTVTQTVGTTPVPDTFSLADEAGVYKSTVYFTAISK